MAVRHKFTDAKVDGADTTLIRASNWNDNHDVQDAFQIVLDGAGSAITTGIKGDIVCPYTGQVVAWTIIADATGSIVVDVWKDTYANYPPVVGDTITSSGKPTLTATTKATGTVNWAFDKGDVLRFNVVSASVVTRVMLFLETVQPPSPPVVPPPPLVGWFMATNGSDTTGNGTIGNPWATMQKFVDSAPVAGATLYIRGGNYPYVGDRNPGFRNARDSWPSLIGTATAPITIRNYPGETVNITGIGGPVISLGPNETSNTIGTNYVVIDGLRFPNANAPDAAVVVIGGFEPTLYLTKNVTIRNCYFSMVNTSAQVDHAIGVIHGADGYTIEDCFFDGPLLGGGLSNAINMYSTPAPINGVFQRNIMINWNIAYQLYDYNDVTPVATAQILHNTFIANTSAVDIRHHAAVTVRDNAFSGANSGATSIYDPNNSASTTADHNFFSQSFDGSYFLVAGQTGRGAASDGTDAGALDW